MSCNSRGVAMMETLIAFVMLAMALWGYMTFANMQISQEAKSAAQASAAAVRNNMFTLLSNPDVWASVVANTTCTSSFACLGSDCSALIGVQSPINCVSDLGGNAIIQPNNQAQGFARDGNPCSAFDPANGSLECPMNYTIDWTPICDAGNCSHPAIEIEAHFRSAWGMNFSFNDSDYDFSLRK